MIDRGRTALLWLLGPYPELDAKPQGERVFVGTVVVSIVAMWLDTKHTFRTPEAEHVWTLALYGLIPLLALGLWMSWRRAAARAVAVGLTAVTALGLGGRVASPDVVGEFIRDRPDWALSITGVLMVAAYAFLARLEVDFDEWGIGLGDWRWWGPRFLAVFFAMELMVIVAAWAVPELRDFYPDNPAARASLAGLLRYQAWLGLYMFGWEMFFRGTFVNGLARRGDVTAALLLPAVAFFLLHWHKPEVEMLASFVGSVGAAWFALNARSFVPVFLMHWMMNLSMELTCSVFRWVGAGGTTG